MALLAAAVEALSEYKKGQAKAADSQWMLTGSYVPGDLGFDPLGLYTIFGKSESGRCSWRRLASVHVDSIDAAVASMASNSPLTRSQAAIKNGRLAMLAITISCSDERVTRTRSSSSSAFLFEPFWKTVETS